MEQNGKNVVVSMAVVAAMTLLMSPARAQLALVPGDVNGDGIVNGLDINLVASHWQDGYGPGDGNGDGIVNGLDLNEIASHWLQTGPTQQQVIASIPAPPASAYTSGYNATALQQIGLTQAVAAEGNYGEGVTIGIVDSGIQVNDPAFYGRISLASTCILGTSVGCENYGNHSINGTDSHGEVVSAVAAGANPLQIGIAPKATIAVMRVAGQSDVDTAIRTAADAGASVINLSLAGALGAVDAINYAASKGALVVVAAGNDGSPYHSGAIQNIVGLSPTALNHVIMVGGVNSSNTIENYSNYPSNGWAATNGSTTLVWDSTQPDGSCPCTGGHWVTTATGPTTPYQSLWLMAPDQVPNEGSGTSFAAPYVTGAIALLDSRWPILVKNGTTAQVLFDSATNLGDPTIYGNGLLNLTAAFQPIGGLAAIMANGASVPVTQTVSMQTGGALGSMTNLALALNNFNVFDSFHRDFPVNLSGMVTANPASSALASQAVTAPQPTVSATHFADGSSLSFGSQDSPGADIAQIVGQTPSNPSWFMSFTDVTGSTLAAGNGFPAQASFAEALWGSESQASMQAGSLGIANSLSSIAGGGMFTAFGTPIGKDTRVAFAWSQTPTTDSTMNTSWTAPNANAMSAGITTHLADGWQAGVTFGSLNEQNGLLGTTYNANGPLGLGAQNKSMSVGLSSAVRLGDKTDLLIEGSVARSAGATGNGLIESVTPLYARSMGASLVERDTINDGDRIELTAKSPLKVYSGSAALATTSVDANGNATTTTQNVSLKPNGTELDLGMAYYAPVQNNLEWNASLTARHDADNIAGNTDVVGTVGAMLRF
jgi:subtilisin family serine protease